MKKFNIKENVSLKKYNSFKVGGSVKFLVENVNVENLLEVLRILNINYLPKVIGGGTNLLINDIFFDECIIKLSDEGALVKPNHKVSVSAGMSLSKFLNFLKKNGCSGLEFLAGVPGTVGGAVFVNAGSKETGILEFIEKITLFTLDKGFYTLYTKDIEYSYRNTNIEGIIFHIEFQFKYQESRKILK